MGIFGANGIVAAGLPIAVGAATAAQLRGDGSVAVAFFGDGAAAQGAFHEAVNLAAVWQLPVIFFCENNGYAEFSPASTQHAASLEHRAGATASNTSQSTAMMSPPRPPPWSRWCWRCASGEGPAFVEAATYRWHGHYEGRSAALRSPDEVQAWQARDPLLVHERWLREVGVGDEEIKALEATIAEELDAGVEAARQLAEPGRRHVRPTSWYVPRPVRAEPPHRR